MKNLILLFVLLLILFSCNQNEEKDSPEYFVPMSEIPGWLKAQIDQDKNLADAWQRYKWQNEFYFEQVDLTSSYSYAIPVSFNGDSLFTYSSDVQNTAAFKSYNQEKCCEIFVWKSGGYISIFGK